MMDKDELTLWLSNSVSETEDGRYRHRLLKEDRSQRDHAFEGLKAYVQQAHEDARRSLRVVMGTSLDPLGDSPAMDPAEGYPERLHIRTLKGYFGEVFAGLISVTLAPFDEPGWAIPAFLFRFHYLAFEQLEGLRQTGGEAGLIPGRTGDDCLAFKLDDKERIEKVLYCEAKCVVCHRTDTVAEAHLKVSQASPVSVGQLITILLDYDDSRSKLWVDALRQFWLQLQKSSQSYERCDLVAYVCGQCPVLEPTWMDRQSPHPNYVAKRKLEAVEAHLENVEELVRQVYGKEDGGDGS